MNDLWGAEKDVLNCIGRKNSEFHEDMQEEQVQNKG